MEEQTYRRLKDKRPIRLFLLVALKKSTKKKEKIMDIILDDFKDIFITDHACMRWKQRVDPISKKEKKKIAEYIRQCADNENIEIGDKNVYVLDDNIVIRVKKRKSGKLMLLTVYGKINEIPALGNIKELLKYNNQRGSKNKVNLRVNKNSSS